MTHNAITELTLDHQEILSLSAEIRDRVLEDLSLLVENSPEQVNEGIDYAHMILELRSMALAGIDLLTDGYTAKVIMDEHYLISDASVEEIIRRLRIYMHVTDLSFCDYLFDAHISAVDGVELIGVGWDGHLDILGNRGLLSHGHRLAFRIS